MSRLQSSTYDVVISDMARDGVHDAGIQLLAKMVAVNINCRTIFTVGRYEPWRGTPAHAFGITNRVDELVNLDFFKAAIFFEIFSSWCE